MTALILLIYKRIGTKAILAIIIPLLRVLAERTDNKIDDKAVELIANALR